MTFILFGNSWTGYEMTNKSNYNAYIMDANKVTRFPHNFKFSDCIEYINNYLLKDGDRLEIAAECER